jgi:hypothetical protein
MGVVGFLTTRTKVALYNYSLHLHCRQHQDFHHCRKFLQTKNLWGQIRWNVGNAEWHYMLRVLGAGMLGWDGCVARQYSREYSLLPYVEGVFANFLSLLQAA